MASVIAQPADLGFVASLARVLTKLVGSVKCSVGVITLFHAVNEPNISIAEYITRIARYAGCSTECFVLCLVYIDRILKQHKNFIISVLNIHRLVITSIMIAAKFYDDLYYSNSFYAKIGGVKTTEINLLEAHFLSLIDFDLYVSGVDYEICRSKIADSEWWSLKCLNTSKSFGMNSRKASTVGRACKSVYTIKSDSMGTPSDNVTTNGVPKTDKNKLLQRMETSYQNDVRAKVDGKFQQINNWPRDKYQYNIAQYNRSFDNKGNKNEFVSRSSIPFSGHANSNNAVNNGVVCDLTLVSTNGVNNAINNGDNIYEMIGFSNKLSSSYPPAYSKHHSSQQVQLHQQHLLGCYWSMQSSAPNACRKQQYHHGMNIQQPMRSNSRPIRTLQQAQMQNLKLHRHDMIDCQPQVSQNTASMQHHNLMSPYSCQQQNNYHNYYGYNNHNCVDGIMHRRFNCWDDEVRERAQFRRSITRHFSDRPLSIGCPSFQSYDY